MAANKGHSADEYWAAYQRLGSARAVAREFGVHATTVDKAIKPFKTDPAIQRSMGAVGTNMVPTMAWAKTAAGEDGIAYSVLLRPAPVEDDFLDRVREAFEGMEPAPPVQKPTHVEKGKIAFFPYGDVHLGIDISADRGGQDYTPEIAVERMRYGFSTCHASIPPCETAVILNNGDLTHGNDDRDLTPRSEHRLKIKGSHRKNLELSVIATAWQIDLALQRHETVVYRPNRGNHDPNTPDTLTIALAERYRNEPRVIIDASERELWVWQRGAVFIASHHGHGIKPKELSANIPAHFPREFGMSRYWYFITSHLHHEKSDTFGPFRWLQLPSICALDQNSADMGYADTAAMRAMMFCEERGLQHDITVRF